MQAADKEERTAEEVVRYEVCAVRSGVFVCKSVCVCARACLQESE